MNDLVKASIDSRKDAIFNAYDIKNQDTINKIEEYFKKVYDFGTNCSDNMDFETKFASSPLNQEYIDLFTLVATSETPKTISSEPTDVKSNGDVIAENAVSDLKYMADDLSQPMRRQARQEAYDQARDIPVVGEVMTAKQHFDFFSRFRKKKTNDEKEN